MEAIQRFFFIKNKNHQASAAFATKLQDTLGKSRILSESRRETRVSAARAERRSQQLEARAAWGRSRSRSPGWSGRDRGGARVPRAAKTEGPASPSAGLTAANPDPWPSWRSFQQLRRPSGAPQGRVDGPFVTNCTASGSGLAARITGAEWRGTPEPRSAHSARSPSWLPLQLPPAPGGLR